MRERKRARGWQANARLLAVACVSLAVAAPARADDCIKSDCTKPDCTKPDCIISDLDNGTEVTVHCTETDVQIKGISGTDAKSPNYFTGGPTSLFSFGLTDSTGESTGKLSNVCCQYLKTLGGLDVTANSADGKLCFKIEIWPTYAGYPRVVAVTLQVTYNGPDATALFNVKLPSLKVTVPGNPMAMVPQMIGGVMPLANAKQGLGAEGDQAAFAATNLPTTLNALEVAELYDGNLQNGGVFFADLDGDYRNNVAPLQFRLTQTDSKTAQITGYWTGKLKRGQPVTLPELAIGTHQTGDWHYAVDYYTDRILGVSRSWAFPDTPKWLREAGAIYLLGVAGGGSFFNTFPATPIDDPNLGIKSFDDCKPGQRCLRDVYNDAQSLGTNVIYLTTWWDHNPTQPLDYYGNKGDYVVRQDMGGAKGLRKAVERLHDKNPRGRVILYLEPYYVYGASILMQPPTSGQTTPPGPGWTWQPTSPLTTGCPSPTPCPTPIPTPTPTFCMSITNTQWQDYLINRAVNLMQETGVDGFFLDSWGFRMNYPANTKSEDVAYSEHQWSAAALRFVDRLRAKLRSINPEAVVLGENNSSEFPFHWDGGSASDLSHWDNSDFTNSQGQLWASPARYAMPLANFFVNGSGLTSMSSGPLDACGLKPINGSAIASVNQVIASGHNLALGPFFLLDVMKVGTVTDDTATEVYPPGKCDGGSKPPPAPTPYSKDVVAKYIKSLVDIRKNKNKNCQDALIYGNQIPTTTCPYGKPCKMAVPEIPANFAVYLYQGDTNQVLAIVNNTSTAKSVTVTLDESLGCGSWNPVLGVKSGTVFTESFSDKCPSKKADQIGTMTVPVSTPTTMSGGPMGGLVILQRPCDTACGVPATFGPNMNTPLMNESFSTAPPYGTGLSNWTDLGFSGKKTKASVWSTGTTTETTKVSTIETSFLKVSSANSALLFYDLFGGGDFTYVGGITVTSFGATGSSKSIGAAGLSFHLSYNDDQTALDAGNMGYDVVLTNDPIVPWSPDPSGSVRLLKRQPTSGGPPTSTVLSQASFGVVANRTYQLSITAQNNWAQPTQFPPSGVPSPDHNQNAYPVWPVSSTFTVSVDGTLLLTYTDIAPYFSGRFGVNATNVNAQFSCLQANGPEDSDGPMPPTCAPTIIRTLPPPGQRSHPQ